MSLRILCGLALVGLSLAPGTAVAARRDVLVVVNRQVADGAAVADAYRAARDIPADHVVAVDLPAAESITRAEYLARIEGPIAAWLNTRAAHDDIVHIVLTRGVPLKVLAEAGGRMPLGSVDSNLALLYRRLTGAPVGPGPLPNPLFTERPAADGQWPAFDRRLHDIYLVSRLDGFTREDAQALATRCGPPPAQVRIVLDGRSPGSGPEHQWLPVAAQRLRERQPTPVVDLDQTAQAISGGAPALGYFAWGTADPSLRMRAPLVSFVPGAVGASMSSSDVRTFKEPPAAWRPGTPGPDARHEGSSDWLAGDWVRAGITGWAGAVADPYVDGVTRPHVFLPAYLSGRSLGEAFGLATRYLGWRTVVLGDPLCRPFGSEPAPADYEREEMSGLTRPMFDRRVDQARRQERPPSVEAAALQVAVGARLGQEQRPRALELLRSWIAAHPDDLAARQLLGLTLNPVTERAEAIEAYRSVLAVRPDDTVMQNNLAYVLATEPDGRAEALRLARRAYEQSRGEPSVADTLGWVLYHTGELDEAGRVLQEAVRRAPRLVDARLHLALVQLKQDTGDRGRQQWLEAGKIDPQVGQRPEAAPLLAAFGPAVPPDVRR
ncbi:hypothetical protein TBR22_A24000 [Luteitalea sp. TBR-22]|uniref:TIGR03790 family protein n=1 Tax=Luteitalea sp. TBR-22 TaxID=2802971 RepID=UPI001AF370D1|nr:TIGR03790 family protein [Luteitalea sp. TBR-22]BCS33173.1 hypothetical protein TBR22_A24000 [Luteitalea sp. TBR-22]